MRRLVALRKKIKAFGCGSMEFLSSDNSHVLAFIRAYEGEQILVVANLSRFVQFVELDLAKFKGMMLIELFGRTPFPPIGDLPYLLTLGPHGFFWFSIEQPKLASATELSGYQLPRIEMNGGFDGILRGEARRELERLLPRYLPCCRWFRPKSRSLNNVTIPPTIPMPEASHAPLLPSPMAPS